MAFSYGHRLSGEGLVENLRRSRPRLQVMRLITENSPEGPRAHASEVFSKQSRSSSVLHLALHLNCLPHTTLSLKVYYAEPVECCLAGWEEGSVQLCGNHKLDALVYASLPPSKPFPVVLQLPERSDHQLHCAEWYLQQGAMCCMCVFVCALPLQHYQHTDVNKGCLVVFALHLFRVSRVPAHASSDILGCGPL